MTTLASSRATSTEDHVALGLCAAPSRKMRLRADGRRLEAARGRLASGLGATIRRWTMAPDGPPPDSCRLARVLTDYHLHLRPDDVGRAADALHRGERRALPRRRSSGEGIEELGVSEHIYRFTEALELWSAAPIWETQAHDDLDAYCEFVRTTPLKLGHRGRLHPRRRGPHRRRCSRLATSTTWSARSTSSGDDGRRGRQPLRRLGADRRPRRALAPLLRVDRRGRALGPVRHPRPPRPGQALGGRAAWLPERDPRAYYEPAVEAVAESGIAVEVSTAGLRKHVGEIYPLPPSPRCASRPGPRSPSPPTPTHPTRSGSPTTRRSSSSPSWGWSASACSTGASAGGADRRAADPSRGPRLASGWSVEAESGMSGHEHARRHRLRLPPPGRGRVADPGRGRDRRTRRAWPGHSDADVLTHAVIDALLGSCGLGDLGEHFPPTDGAVARRRLDRPARVVVGHASAAAD